MECNTCNMIGCAKVILCQHQSQRDLTKNAIWKWEYVGLIRQSHITVKMDVFWDVAPCELKMGAVCFSETSTRHYDPEDQHLHKLQKFSLCISPFVFITPVSSVLVYIIISVELLIYLGIRLLSQGRCVVYENSEITQEINEQAILTFHFSVT